MSSTVALVVVGIVFAVLLGALGVETAHDNPVGWIVLLIGVGYCMGGSLYLAAEKNRVALREETGGRSLWAVAPGFAVVFLAPPLEYLYLPALLPRSTAMQTAGLALIAAALGLRVWSRLSLREQYSGRLRIQAGHRLVTTGPHRFMRHPGYAGFLLLGLGLAIGYSSTIGLVAVPVLLLPGLVYRIHAEEALLTTQFGEAYLEYARRTRRLLPGIW